MLKDNLQKRRSIYGLNNNMPISDDKLQHLLEQCLLNCPTAFNAQSSRLVVLLGENHQKYWQMVSNAIKKVSAPEKLEGALQRLSGFTKAYGTVVFYEDTDVLDEMAKKYADYADKMDKWLQQGNAMLQFMVWQCLAESEIGASLQHYGNLVEQEAKTAYHLPERWQWVAEMPFGGITAPAGNKDFAPLEQRLKVLK